MSEMQAITVLGAGLAGCEAALWLAGQGVQVHLYEQKPVHFSPAHKAEGFAELICSNSLKAERLDSASGLLKAEMKMLGSSLLGCAEATRVAAGGALAVDRDAFSQAVTALVEGHGNITIHRERVERIDDSRPVLVATGPLTDGELAADIQRLIGGQSLSFYDAAAPIVTAESLDMEKVFAASRYGRGDADYLNCPFNKAEYEAFHAALSAAERAPLHDFDADGDLTVYEGCMPIEVMASRGEMVMAFGPMKPVGLTDPRTGREPYAAVQLRAENNEGTMYNLVGFQTRLKWGEQKRVFSMIPGLENAEFLRYGVMHRNTFLHSPGFLDQNYQMIARPGVYFAGQMTGVEGYVESASSGMVAGISLARQMLGKEPVDFTQLTAIGGLAHHVAHASGDFQPMNANFGLIAAFPKKIRNKQERYGQIAARALDVIEAIRSNPLCEDFYGE